MSPRRLEYTASLTRTRSWNTALPASFVRSSATLRLSWLNVSKNSESSPDWYGGTARPTSPPVRTSSILITSAPSSARWTVPNGPAPYCSTATTRTSASGRGRAAVLIRPTFSAAPEAPATSSASAQEVRALRSVAAAPGNLVAVTQHQILVAVEPRVDLRDLV